MGNETETFTGGARIGGCNATWPFAKLTVTKEKLLLKVRILGDYEFAASDVVSLSKYSIIPFFGWGIRIEHTAQNCSDRVIFWCLGRPEKVLEKITAKGFIPSAIGQSSPKRSFMPIRWEAIVVAIAAWNLPFMLIPSQSEPRLSAFLLLPLLLAFGGGILLLRIPSLQRLVMKPGRDIGEIRPWINLVILIAGIMTVIFGIVIAFGGNIQPIKQ